MVVFFFFLVFLEKIIPPREMRYRSRGFVVVLRDIEYCTSKRIVLLLLLFLINLNKVMNRELRRI